MIRPILGLLLIWLFLFSIVVTVYALADDSTYFPENIANEKVFVSRDELLKKLSKNIYGNYIIRVSVILCIRDVIWGRGICPSPDFKKERKQKM